MTQLDIKALIYEGVREKPFMQQVLEIGERLGWLMYHTYDSRRCEAGFPDLTCVHPHRGEFFMAELKTQRGRLTKHQVKWVEALARAGIHTYVWRPGDIDEIIRILQGTGL